MSFVAWNINNPSISGWKNPTKITFWLNSLKRELWRDNIFWCTKVQTVKAFYIDISYFFVAWLLSVRDLMTFCYVDLCSFITLILFFFYSCFSANNCRLPNKNQLKISKLHPAYQIFRTTFSFPVCTDAAPCQHMPRHKQGCALTTSTVHLP